MDEQRIRIFAIDDDRIFLKLLESAIREVEDELDIKASMTFCTQPPADLNVMEYNLFFVDIEMPYMVWVSKVSNSLKSN